MSGAQSGWVTLLLAWRRPLLALAGVGGLVGLLLVGGLIGYSRTADHACQRCHSARSGLGWSAPGDRWHVGVACTACHAPHGEVLSLEFGATRVRTDEACRGCHPASASRAQAPSRGPDNPQGLIFSHLAHLERGGVSCSGCHAELFHAQAPRAAARPTMAGCLQECHRDGDTPAGCRVCHEEAAITPPVDGPLDEASCARCHFSFGQRTTVVAGRAFRHWLHLGGGVTCATCHRQGSGVAHGTLVQRADCQQCHHREKRGVDCEGCHRVERDWRLGLTGPTTLAGLEARPEGMVGLAECGDCHTDLAARTTSVATPEAVLDACIKCHATDDPAKVIPELLASWRQAHVEAEEISAALRISGPAERPIADERDILRQLLLRDRSRGAHNPALTAALLERARLLQRARVAAMPVPATASGATDGVE